MAVLPVFGIDLPRTDVGFLKVNEVKSNENRIRQRRDTYILMLQDVARVEGSETILFSVLLGMAGLK